MIVYQVEIEKSKMTKQIGCLSVACRALYSSVRVQVADVSDMISPIREEMDCPPTIEQALPLKGAMLK